MPYNDDLDNNEAGVGGVVLGFIILGAVLAIFLLSGCVYADAKHTVALGGKGAYKSAEYALTWDNEKSFNDAAWVATLAIPAIQAVKTVQATEATARAVDANRSAEAINASNNAVKTAEITAEVTKHSTVNPNVIPK